jgi:hypothetical protein
MWIVWQGNLRPRVQVPGGGEGIAKKTVSERGSVRRPAAAERPKRTQNPPFKAGASSRNLTGLCAAQCEACHIGSPDSALSITPSGPLSIEDETMKLRRKAYWWFRFVFSGRFLEKFLNLRYDAFVAKASDSEPRDRRDDDRRCLSQPEIS